MMHLSFYETIYCEYSSTRSVKVQTVEMLPVSVVQNTAVKFCSTLVTAVSAQATAVLRVPAVPAKAVSDTEIR